MNKKPIDTYKQIRTSHDVSPYRTVQCKRPSYTVLQLKP
jgi:hypothetical protein